MVDFRARPVFVSKLERAAVKILRAVVLRDYTSRLACVWCCDAPCSVIGLTSLCDFKYIVLELG